VSLLPLLAGVLVLALALAGVLGSRGWRRSAVALAAVFLGPFLYFVVGIVVPQVSGRGHFYSFPVGGLRVRDDDILLSLLAWIVACGALLRVAARRRP
jgi:hypothetical protein